MGKTQSNPRESVGRRSADNIQQGETEIIQVNEQRSKRGANRVRTGRQRVNPGNTARIETLENTQGKARLRQLRGFRIAAKTRRVINAEQYWD